MNEKVKEQLQNLLDIIEKLCEHEEYRWFKIELQKRFGGKKSATETSSVSMGGLSLNEDETNKLDAIYEYCIHDLLKKQADSFFKGLSLPGPTLESIKSAYISMEKSKGRFY